MNILQKRKMNSRLVKAAATEKTSPSVQASSRRKVRLSNWKGGSFGWRKHSDTVSEGGTTTTTCETREGANDDDFFRRFHVTVVKTRTESSRPELEEPRSDVRLPEGTAKKSVRFHKYDEVWNGGAREFVYSLYDRERQEESDRDITDDFEDVVGNVSHFFKCIKKGIEDVTNSKRASPPLSNSFSEHDDEESYQSYTDDEESSMSTYGMS